MHLSLKQLRYICAVAEHRHFGKAAEACYVTQSTLSAGVNELESQLDARVFERHNKQVLITPCGKEIIRRAQIILRESEDLIAYTHAKQAPLSSELHLGVIPTIAPFLLPRLLSYIYHRFPRLNLFLREDLSANLLERLQQGELDLILWALPYPSTDTREIALFKDAFIVVLPLGHPLSKTKKLRQKDLQGEEVLLLEEGHCMRDHALEACQLRDQASSQKFQASSLHTLVQLVANGIGLTLLPQMAVDSGILKDTSLIPRPFEEQTVCRTIGLAWRNSDPRHEEYRLLAQTIQQHHQEQSQPTAAP